MTFWLLFGTYKPEIAKKNFSMANAHQLDWFSKKCKFHLITGELINELHWLHIKQCIDYKILDFVYIALHGQAPSDVTDMLQITTHMQFTCSDSTTLVKPRTLFVTFGDQAFSAYAPRLWNRLPGQIKDSTFEQFKKLLNKSHFSKDAYQQ